MVTTRSGRMIIKLTNWNKTMSGKMDGNSHEIVCFLLSCAQKMDFHAIERTEIRCSGENVRMAGLASCITKGCVATSAKPANPSVVWKVPYPITYICIYIYTYIYIYQNGSNWIISICLYHSHNVTMMFNVPINNTYHIDVYGQYFDDIISHEVPVIVP